MFASLIATLIFAATSAPLDAVPQTRLDGDLRCLLGVYSLPEGRFVTITGVDGQPRGLHYTLSSGQFGTLQQGAAGTFAASMLEIDFEPCSVGTLKLMQGKIAAQGVHLKLIETETTFESDGTKLHGKFVIPPNGKAESAAVWIEGSNNDPSTDDTVWQYELAKRGVAIFIYDKRGTGASAGALSSDFKVRALDTAAAVNEVRRLAPSIAQVGVIGGSQGGWVAPLSATLVHVDFVIAAFAMAEGPIAQDKELVELQLRQAGFEETELEAARQLTAITERIVRSNMLDGFADLDAFKSKYASMAWINAIQPRSYTGIFLKFSSEDIRTNGPALAQGLSFDFDPRPIIETIEPRQLWLLGGSDQQAPNAATQEILKQIQVNRPNIAVVVFPNADHGLIEQTESANGPAQTYSAKLFDVTADWIKDQKLPSTGNFIVMPTSN